MCRVYGEDRYSTICPFDGRMGGPPCVMSGERVGGPPCDVHTATFDTLLADTL